MNHEPELLQALRRLMPVLEQAIKHDLIVADAQMDFLNADMATLRTALAEPAELLSPPEGVDPRDTCTLLGEGPDGSRVVLGTVAISPEAKLLDLTREQFGPISEDEFSEEVDAFFIGQAVLAHVQRERPTLPDAVAHARERVKTKFGDFHDDEGSIAADAFYIAETLLKWMGIAHPQTFKAA